MQFTYRNPERSTDPDRLLPGARALVVGAWGYRRTDDGPTSDGVAHRRSQPLLPRGEVARYARRDHYASLRQRPRAPGRPPLRGRAGGPPWSATTTLWSTGRRPTAPVSAGTARTPSSCCPASARGSCWAVWSPMPRSLPTRRRSRHRRPPGAGPASGAGPPVRPAPWSSPGVLDASRCLAWLVQSPGSFPVEHRRALGGRVYGCDECQQVCPINRLPTERRHRPPSPEADTEPSVDLLALLAASDDELLRTHGRWYIPERDPRYLRRNALVALGNVGDGTDPRHPADRRALDGRRRPDDRRACPVGGRPSSASTPPPPTPGGTRSVTHLLVTNDFPPKVGGIQAYLWELWRRLDPATLRGAHRRRPTRAPQAFDRAQAERGFRIERVPGRVLAPTPRLVRRIRAAARRVGADLVVLDPAFPLGRDRSPSGSPTPCCSTGPRWPSPAACPAAGRLLAHVLRHSGLVVSAGGYPAAEPPAGRCRQGGHATGGGDPARGRPRNASVR